MNKKVRHSTETAALCASRRNRGPLILFAALVIAAAAVLAPRAWAEPSEHQIAVENTPRALEDEGTIKIPDAGVADGTDKNPVFDTSPALNLEPIEEDAFWEVDATWTRLWGDTALDTMVQIVNTSYTTPSGTEFGRVFETGGTVIIATSGGYWDALSACGLAGIAQCPVLMTEPSRLSPQTKELLGTLAPSAVIVVGGTKAIEDKVLSQIRNACGIEPVRIAGKTATSTACAILEHAKNVHGAETRAWSDTCIVATNNGYWDALAAAPYAYAKHCPIVLTEGAGSISQESLNTMKECGIKRAIIVGGEKAVSSHVREQIESAGITVSKRLWGADAIKTSQAIADFAINAGMRAEYLGVATTNGYWDALCGAALCGRVNSVLLLADGPSASSVSGWVRYHPQDIGHGWVFGGTSAVSDDTRKVLAELTTAHHEPILGSFMLYRLPIDPVTSWWNFSALEFRPEGMLHETSRFNRLNYYWERAEGFNQLGYPMYRLFMSPQPALAYVSAYTGKLYWGTGPEMYESTTELPGGYEACPTISVP